MRHGRLEVQLEKSYGVVIVTVNFTDDFLNTANKRIMGPPSTVTLFKSAENTKYNIQKPKMEMWKRLTVFGTNICSYQSALLKSS